MADKLREQIARTNYQFAYWIDDKDIARKWKADKHKKRWYYGADHALNLFKSQVEGLTVIGDEGIQKASDKYVPVWEVGGKQLSKVEILQRQHARLRAIAKAQLQDSKDKLLEGLEGYIWNWKKE